MDHSTRSIGFTRNLMLALVAAACGANVACAAQRTFVASYGNDANACSRVSPCRSFAAAMSHTDDGGEVTVLDSAGYGTVAISQSVSLIAPGGVYAGITALAGDNGIEIDAAGVRVTLRGLHVNGLAGSSTGINFVQGAALHVERCAISGFDIAGLYVRAEGEVFVRDSSLQRISGDAIRVGGVHEPSVARLAIVRTHVSASNSGVSVYANAKVLFSDSVVAGAAFNGVQASGPNADDVADIVVERSSIVYALNGIYVGHVVGALGSHRVIVDGSTVAWNSTGWNVRNDANTNLYTRSNNVLRFNGDNQFGKAPVALTAN
jgi:hypothetical protein